MRLVCLIDSLGPGGAQRQLSTLAVLLGRRGFDVEVLTYHAGDFFLPELARAGIPVRCVERGSIARRALALRGALRASAPDVVLAFLDASCLYAELAALPARRFGLVVSERLAVPREREGRLRWTRQLHRVADFVVTNSHTNRLLIERAVPALAGRLVTIYNAVDLDAFRPPVVPPSPRQDALRLVVAASYQAKKNLAGMIDAVARARRLKPERPIVVDWYGGSPRGGGGRPDVRVREEGLAQIRVHRLEECFRLHDTSRSMVEIYQAADAVVLPSFFEGLPNTVCEAMACGRPVLMSAVCDASGLVEPGRSGLLFDPSSPEDMARALVAMALLSPAERDALGARARAIAERTFDGERFAGHYAEVLRAAASRERVAIPHWLPEVPATALRSVA